MFGMHIDFGCRTFKWGNEAKGKAAVHCVIVGFSAGQGGEKAIYDGDSRIIADNISPYLVDAPDVFIESRRKPLCDVPEMVYGNKPVDGGHLFISADEYDGIVALDPDSKKYIRRVTGSDEYINNTARYCLWLVDANPAELRKQAFVMERIEKVRRFREGSPKKQTREGAATPALFMEIRQPNENYIIVPRVSSERRAYIPIGFLSPDIIVTDSVSIVPNISPYHFGILTSSAHMAWVRAVCGRLKSDYRYSIQIVYNNFPWPTATEAQTAEIEGLARAVLGARELYHDSSLADLYDPLTMPPGLLKAHRALDAAVMRLYGFPVKADEATIVAALMERYMALVEKALRR
jgi:hypothetical protein